MARMATSLARTKREDRKSLPKPTLASTIYLQLRREIIHGELKPDFKLKVRDLCLRLDVGVSPIREALSRLTAEGLVRQLDQRGFSVAPIDEAGLTELTRTRCWLNEIGLRQSITNGGIEWEEAVVIARHHLLGAPRTVGDDPTSRMPEWIAAHMRFHQALISASGSQWLTAFCGQLFEGTERYRHLSGSTRTRESVDAEHDAIAEAALSRDANKAVAVMKDHFEMTAFYVRQGLQAMKE